MAVVAVALVVGVATPAFGEAAAPDLGEVLTSLRNWLVGLLAAAATLALTIGGIRYVAGAGDPTQIEKAKTAFRSAVVGYAIAPLLADLAAALQNDDDPAARTLAARLAPYTSGTHKRLFDGPTTTRPEDHLVVFALRDLPDELTATGMLLALDAIWRQVTNPTSRQRRLVVVDEAWQLMRSDASARFLYRLAKAGRKHWCGLTTVTQDIGDLLVSDLGKAVIANAATHILLGQAPQAIAALTETFNLSEGERAFLLAARRGEGILASGQQRAAFHAEASPSEAGLVTTDPEFLAALEAEERNSRVDGS